MGILGNAGVGLTDEVKEAVVLYGHMVDSMRKVEALREAKKPSKDEEVRFHKLEARVNAAMAALPDESHRLIVDKLVIQGLMPEEVKDIVRVFEGRISKC